MINSYVYLYFYSFDFNCDSFYYLLALDCDDVDIDDNDVRFINDIVEYYAEVLIDCDYVDDCCCFLYFIKQINTSFVMMTSYYLMLFN